MLTAPVNGSAPRSSLTIDVPRLLAAAPSISVSDELDRHVEDIRRLAPASDATTALALYGHHNLALRRELQDLLNGYVFAASLNDVVSQSLRVSQVGRHFRV